MRITFIAMILAAIGVAWTAAGTMQTSGETLAAKSAPAGELRAYGVMEHEQGPSHGCVGKSRCVAVHLAPWCPICKRSLPLVDRLREEIAQRPDTGVVVVVGAVGRPWRDYQSMSEQISGPVRLDPNDEFGDTLRGTTHGVPAWVAYDAQGRITEAFSGGFRKSPEERVDDVIARLNLDGVTAFGFSF